MSHGETLSKMFHDIQLGGRVEKKEMLALLAILKDMDDRLEKVEQVCKIARSA
jgi:hypothetical protein